MANKHQLHAVNAVLNKVLTGLGLDRRLREHTFMTLWPTFVNSALSERSRPLFIDADRNLVITVADAATGQELSMIKARLAAKVTAAARGLNIDVRGLRLDMKHFHQRSTMPEIPEPKPLPKPTEKQLSEIPLSADDYGEIAQLQADLREDETVDRALAAKMAALHEREMRIRRWRFLNNFPVCPQCREPVERLLPPDRNAPNPRRDHPAVCMTCFYAQ